MNPPRHPLHPASLCWFVLAGLAGAGAGWLSRRHAAAMKDGASLVGNPLQERAAVKATPLERWMQALNAGTPAQQLEAVLRMAEVASVEDVRALLDHAYAFPKNAAAGLAVNVLLGRWLELDAAAALNYANLRQQAHWPGLLASYAVKYPAEAEAYWRTFPAGKASKEAWEGLCEGLMAAHPAKAWRLLEVEGDHSFGRMVRKLAARDVEETVARLDTIADGWRGTARCVIAAQLAKRDPARALAWIADQKERRGLLNEVIAVIYRKDPAMAFGLLESLSGQDQINAVSFLTSENGNGDPSLDLHQAGTGRDDAALAAAVMGSPLDEPQKTSLLNRFFWQDADRGQAFWNHFSEPDQLLKLPGFLWRWSVVDKAAPEAWWRSLPPGPVRSAAETHWQELELAWHQQGRSAVGRLRRAIRGGGYPDKADSRLADLTHGELTDLLPSSDNPDPSRIIALVRVVGASNPEAVADWLDSVFVTDETGPTVAEFSARWALDDSAAAAAWVSRLPEGKLADTAAFNIARQYQVYDPEGAQQWMEGLVEKTVQEAARKGLLADREMDSE